MIHWPLRIRQCIRRQVEVARTERALDSPVDGGDLA
jgi:hypothetical protein